MPEAQVCDICAAPTYDTTCVFCRSRIEAIEADPDHPAHTSGKA